MSGYLAAHGGAWLALASAFAVGLIANGWLQNLARRVDRDRRNMPPYDGTWE